MVHKANFRGGYSIKTICLSSEKGSTQKGKNLLPLGANFFLFEQTIFQKGFGVQEGKQEVSNIISIVENDGISTKSHFPTSTLFKKDGCQVLAQVYAQRTG